jgi:hypothetical protein
VRSEKGKQIAIMTKKINYKNMIIMYIKNRFLKKIIP